MPKRVIVCCDGTWSSLDHRKKDGALTNVSKLLLSIRPADDAGITQTVAYVAGVGTGRFDRLRGGAFGVGLSANVKAAYGHIVRHYEPGDEIWLFGFSRGAFTARSTAGLVRNCGILLPAYADRVDDAYSIYRDRGSDAAPDAPAALTFRRRHSYPQPDIRFIGVWDTVGSLGIPASRWNPLRLLNRRWRFHDCTLSSWVRHARHALAIDETRVPFVPTMWDRSERAGPGQTLEQVWFTGVHSDVGGGFTDAGLSQVGLSWMVTSAEACGLAVDRALLAVPGAAAPPPIPAWMADRARTHRLGDGDPDTFLRSLATAPDPMGRLHAAPGGLLDRLVRHRTRALPHLTSRTPPRPFPDQSVADTAAHRHVADAEYAAASPQLGRYLASGRPITGVGM